MGLVCCLFGSGLRKGDVHVLEVRREGTPALYKEECTIHIKHYMRADFCHFSARPITEPFLDPASPLNFETCMEVIYPVDSEVGGLDLTWFKHKGRIKRPGRPEQDIHIT